MSVHTCHTGHKGILADGCERCAEHAANPFAALDTDHLAGIARIALDKERLGRGHTVNDLIAAKHVLDTIDRMGRLLEVTPRAVIEDLRGRWRIPINYGGN